MLTFARNKLVSVTRKNRDTLSIHGVLDDDIYGLEIDLDVSLKERKLLAISGKWNRYTTPECRRAIVFIREMTGERIDETIAERIDKILGRRGCRHFANLLIECCYAATQAARVVLWQDAKVANPDLGFKSFVEGETRESGDIPAGDFSGEEPNELSPSPLQVQTTRPAREPTPRPRQDPREEFVIDLHTHSFPASPCSSSSVGELIEEAKRIGLNGICLTDHNHVWPLEQVEELRKRHSFFIFRGNEITTDQGDMLVFGLEKDIKGIITLPELREEVIAAGGFLIAAHPFRGFLTFSTVQLGLTRETAAQRPLFQWIDGVEVLNGKVTEKENGFAASVAQTLRLPGTGGSDAHRAAEVGHYATRFFTAIHTEAELIRALAGRDYAPAAFRREKALKDAGH